MMVIGLKLIFNLEVWALIQRPIIRPCRKCCSSSEKLSDLIVPHSWPWWPLSCALRILAVSSARTSPKTYFFKERSLFLQTISFPSSPYSRQVLEYFSIWQGLLHCYQPFATLFHHLDTSNTFKMYLDENQDILQ